MTSPIIMPTIKTAAPTEIKMSFPVYRVTHDKAPNTIIPIPIIIVPKPTCFPKGILSSSETRCL